MQLPNILERKWEGLIAFLSADPGPTAAWRRRCLQTQDQRPPGGGAGRQGSLAMPEKRGGHTSSLVGVGIRQVFS